LSYLATMPKDINLNRSKSQPISPIQIFINKGITTFHTTKSFVRKGLDPFRNTNGTARDRSLRQSSPTSKRNGAPYPLRYQGRDCSLRQNHKRNGAPYPLRYQGRDRSLRKTFAAIQTERRKMYGEKT